MNFQHLPSSAYHQICASLNNAGQFGAYDEEQIPTSNNSKAT
jgi:hypothetical protein